YRHSCQDHWGWGCSCWGGWLWGWDWNCFWEPHHWLCQEPFSEATALLLSNSGLCPLRGHGALLPNGGLFHPLRHMKQLSPLPPPIVLLCPVCLVCSFSCTSPGSLGKVIGSGFDKEKTNKYCINKVKKKRISPFAFSLLLLFLCSGLE
ncbi:hypothetical protein LEMLEM_LOCUS19640, partial [Lemmus lemmus]